MEMVQPQGVVILVFLKWSSFVQLLQNEAGEPGVKLRIQITDVDH